MVFESKEAVLFGLVFNFFCMPLKHLMSLLKAEVFLFLSSERLLLFPILDTLKQQRQCKPPVLTLELLSGL